MCPESSSSVGGSMGSIVPRKSAEATKESVSARRVNGAEISWTRKPPRLGPATNQKARLPFRSELPSR